MGVLRWVAIKPWLIHQGVVIFQRTRVSVAGWIVLEAGMGPWWECNVCQGCRNPEAPDQGAGLPRRKLALCVSPRSPLHMLPCPTGSCGNPRGAVNIEVAQNNLRCFAYKVSLWIKLGIIRQTLWSKPSDILEAECTPLPGTVPGKGIKRPHWGYKHEVCFFHNWNSLMFTSYHGCRDGLGSGEAFVN